MIKTYLKMPRSSKKQSSYAQLWKNLTQYAIEPAVKRKISSVQKKQGSKKRGGTKQLHQDWFKPLKSLAKTSSRGKQQKTRTQKKRGGFIRGCSRVLPTMQEQCSLLPIDV